MINNADQNKPLNVKVFSKAVDDQSRTPVDARVTVSPLADTHQPYRTEVLVVLPP